MDNSDYHYKKIEKAIAYIDGHFKGQPSLDEIAEHINLSPYHFQRLFKEWAGISPKKYLQFISTSYAKSLIKKENISLFDAAYETGLSGTGRLHDLFVNLEGMTPGEYKNGGENLSINFSYAESPFGDMMVASTHKGLCHMVFIDDIDTAFTELKSQFPRARYLQKVDKVQQDALFIFQNDWEKLNEIKLHIKGTAFQLKVWEALLSVPQGSLVTYSDISKKIDQPQATRAVGTAIGNNTIAYLIPCHRVIQQSGNIGGYRWNTVRKKAIIGWEASSLPNV